MINTLMMHKALKLAFKGKESTTPNPMVGSVIYKGDHVIACGWHKRAGSDHAEIVALKKAGKRARGATLTVNLEPCFHHGRTPPCVDAIIRAGISKVIIAIKDPNPLTKGKSIRKLRRAGIKVETDLLKEEATRLNEVFIKYVTRQMPFVAAKSAQTIDGKIATKARDSKWITAAKTREFARVKRNEFDAIMVGIETVLQDDPRLEPADKKKRLKKIIVDSKGRVPIKAKLFTSTKLGQCIVATTRKMSKVKMRALEKKGIDVIICPEKKAGVDLKSLFKTLAKMEITSILLEGGAHLLGSALSEGLVDKYFIYIAPKILGDKCALDAVSGLRARNISDSINLKNIKIYQIADDLMIEGYIKQ